MTYGELHYGKFVKASFIEEFIHEPDQNISGLDAAAALLFGVQLAYAQSGAVAHPSPAKENSKSFAIPRPMEIEHEELHSNLAQLSKAGGRTGEAANAVAAVLDHHFAKRTNMPCLPSAC